MAAVCLFRQLTVFLRLGAMTALLQAAGECSARDKNNKSFQQTCHLTCLLEK